LPITSSRPTMLPILNTSSDQQQIAALRAKLSLKPLLLEGLDEEAGDAQSKFETVREILRDVQTRGDEAVFEYTRKFDNAAVDAQTIRVGPGAVAKAVRAASPE